MCWQNNVNKSGDNDDSKKLMISTVLYAFFYYFLKKYNYIKNILKVAQTVNRMHRAKLKLRAVLTTPQKVLSISELVKLRRLDFSDFMRTDISFSI